MCRPCKSVWWQRHCNSIILDTLASLPPRTRSSDGTAHRVATTHGPERAQDTPSGRVNTRFHGETPESRARGPGRGQGRPAPTSWFWSQGNGDWALETRLAEQPCRGNSQGNAKLARKRAGSDIEDLRLESENRTAALPSKHPDELFRCAAGAGL